MTRFGSNPALPSVLLNSHIDVVPAFKVTWNVCVKYLKCPELHYIAIVVSVFIDAIYFYSIVFFFYRAKQLHLYQLKL